MPAVGLRGGEAGTPVPGHAAGPAEPVGEAGLGSAVPAGRRPARVLVLGGAGQAAGKGCGGGAETPPSPPALRAQRAGQGRRRPPSPRQHYVRRSRGCCSREGGGTGPGWAARRAGRGGAERRRLRRGGRRGRRAVRRPRQRARERSRSGAGAGAGAEPEPGRHRRGARAGAAPRRDADRAALCGLRAGAGGKQQPEADDSGGSAAEPAGAGRTGGGMGRAGRAGGGGPDGRRRLLLLLGAVLIAGARLAGAAPASEPSTAGPAPPAAGEPQESRLPRANDTRLDQGAGEHEVAAASEGRAGRGEDEAGPCWDCPPGPPGAGGALSEEALLEASAAVTGAAWPEAMTLELTPENREDAGSGDPQAGRGEVPPSGESWGPASEPGGAKGPPSPTPGGRLSRPLPGSVAHEESPLQLWLSPGPAAASAPPGTPEPQPSSEAVDLDYYDGLDPEARGPPDPAHRHVPPGEDAPSWGLPDMYDDFTPFDESDFYPTTSFYELEEDEEDEEEEAAGRDLEDGDGRGLAGPAPSSGPGLSQPTGRWHGAPPQRPLGVPGPGEAGRELAPSGNGTVCRSGFVRHNGSCRSVCDLFPSYCHHGGQCYLVENLGAFCRCNTQDYIWHKGMRCESIITDFQVMCVAVGTAALVLLLLFMMTVFFAKKLYLLKTENSKLRKTKFRTPSELHNDNFSLSTIAEGSHPNVRKLCNTPRTSSPHARALAYYDNVICQDDSNISHKMQDVLKSCLKEEESFNIQNSMSPKHDSSKGDQEESEVNCLQNNLT
ncbi:chondroitin sulfate proteoglycan 5 isoform X2 [Notamacropus eugenii]|uniref:chondroitin sulfate proteoglycan 5 isoform X2 n=1 Tax=Notamacropus eugenii TaxID=9315 RepID=UPI003B6788D6